MKNFNWKKLVNIGVGLLVLVLYVVYFIFTLSLKRDSVFTVIGFSMLGLLSAYVITAIFHEIGHLVLGAITKLKLCYFQFFGVRVSKKDDGKISISLQKDGVLGETAFYPSNGDDVAKKIGLTALGGPIFTFIQTIVYLVISIVFMENTAIFCVFGISFVVPLYVFLINIIPFSYDYDGAIVLTMLSGGKKAIIASSYITASALIYKGEEPYNVSGRYLTTYDENYDFFSVKVIHLRYLSSLINNEETAFKELDKISDKDKLPDGTYGDVIYELLFRALILGDEEYIKENKDEVLDYLAMDDSPTSIRVQVALCIYEGDYQRADLLIKSGIETCATYPVIGIAKFEKQMLEKFSQALEQAQS